MLAKLAVDSDTRARAARARARTRGRLHRRRATRSPRRAPPRAARWRATCRLFPPFLEQLGPGDGTARRFADQTTPVFTDLGKSRRPASTRHSRSLPAFSKSSTTFFKNLGKTAKQSRARRSSRRRTAAQPAEDARRRRQAVRDQPRRRCSTSLRETGGLERLLDFIFLGAGAANGYDALGHFLRTEGVGTRLPRHTRSTADARAAAANSFNTAARRRDGQRAAPHRPRSTTSLVMARTLAVLKGATPAQALAKYPGSAPSAAANWSARGRGVGAPRRRRPSRSAARRPARPTTRPPAKAPKPAACCSTTCSGTDDAMSRLTTPPRPCSRSLARALALALLAPRRRERGAEAAAPRDVSDDERPRARRRPPPNRSRRRATTTRAAPSTTRRTGRRRRCRPSISQGATPARHATRRHAQAQGRHGEGAGRRSHDRRRPQPGRAKQRALARRR